MTLTQEAPAPYDALRRVPLALQAPGYRPKVVVAPVELLDVYPALLELARLPPPSSHGLEGRSLVPLMRPT